MGSMTYNRLIVHVEDRALAHLQIVIGNKLRSSESFLMSWKDAPESGGGRRSVWIHPLITLYFKYEGSRIPAINPDWLSTLALSANSSRGLIVTAESGELQPVGLAQARRSHDTLMSMAHDPNQIAS